MDEGKAKETIDYKQGDQALTVRDIFHLISVESPIAVVSRLVSSLIMSQAAVAAERRNLQFLSSVFEVLLQTISYMAACALHLRSERF